MGGDTLVEKWVQGGAAENVAISVFRFNGPSPLIFFVEKVF